MTPVDTGMPVAAPHQPDAARTDDARAAHLPGMGWVLSDETKAALAEIDASIRQARIDGPTALFD